MLSTYVYQGQGKVFLTEINISRGISSKVLNFFLLFLEPQAPQLCVSQVLLRMYEGAAFDLATIVLQNLCRIQKFHQNRECWDFFWTCQEGGYQVPYWAFRLVCACSNRRRKQGGELVHLAANCHLSSRLQRWMLLIFHRDPQFSSNVTSNGCSTSNWLSPLNQ